jgi:hypothetical protein
MDYMILQSKPASTRVCRGCHRGVTMGGLAFILWYELFTVTVPQCPNRSGVTEIVSVTLGTTLD